MAPESMIASQIQIALAQYLKRDVAKIAPTDRLREDLGLDSLAMIELLFKIEEHFDLEIPNEDLSRITTVADVTAYVEEKVATLPADRQPALTSASLLKSAPTKAPEAAAKAPEVKSPRPARLPANVTPIKAAAKRKAAGTGGKAAPVKKKGSRRA